MKERNYVSAFAWGQDFWRAFHERPIILRWLAYLCMGRFAARELVGMRDAIEKEGFSTHYPYDSSLREMEYHNETVDWWA